MEVEVGDRGFPLWLIGDSNPAQWELRLKTPFDPRHPVRHNIWTPILDVIQGRVYRGLQTPRVDSSKLYIRQRSANPAEEADFFGETMGPLSARRNRPYAGPDRRQEARCGILFWCIRL